MQYAAPDVMKCVNKSNTESVIANLGRKSSPKMFAIHLIYQLQPT
jgi:hypothetical protein